MDSRQTDKTLQENIWMCFNSSPSTQKLHQHCLRWDPWLDEKWSEIERQILKSKIGGGGKIVICLQIGNASMGDKTDILGRRVPNLSETRCFIWHLLSHPCIPPSRNRELAAAPLLRLATRRFTQHLLGLCKAKEKPRPTYDPSLPPHGTLPPSPVALPGQTCAAVLSAMGEGLEASA